MIWLLDLVCSLWLAGARFGLKGPPCMSHCQPCLQAAGAGSVLAVSRGAPLHRGARPGRLHPLCRGSATPLRTTRGWSAISILDASHHPFWCADSDPFLHRAVDPFHPDFKLFKAIQQLVELERNVVRDLVYGGSID